MSPELYSPLIAAGLVILGGAIAWIVAATRTDAKTVAVQSDFTSLRGDHGKRLDGHDAEIAELRQNYVTRRELDERMSTSMTAINKQLDVHGRWLEYAIFNKKPNQPSINGDEK